MTLSHAGFGGVRVTGVTFAGSNPGDFSIALDPCTGTALHGVAPPTCDVLIGYRPTGPDTRSATVTFDHDGDGPPIVVELTGGSLGVPTAAVQPTSINFGEQLGLTPSAGLPVTVSNPGDGPITITGVAIEGGAVGEFTASRNCVGTVVAPGQACVITVVFTPQLPGARTAVLRVDSTARGGPHRVTLTGTGAQPTLIVNPGVAKGGSVVLAQGSKFPPGPLTLTFVEVTGAVAQFPEAPTTITVPADGTFVAAVAIFPNSRSGTRALLGAVGAFSGSSPLLIRLGTMQGPDFVIRS